MSIELAKATLNNENLTCVITDGTKIVFKSTKRGVTPLVLFILKNINGKFFLADKVIGKAAALLCCKANIKHVFTSVISTPAIDILNKENIYYEFNKQVDSIKNRDNTDLCPMEYLSKGITDCDSMFEKVYSWLKQQKLL